MNIATKVPPKILTEEEVQKQRKAWDKIDVQIEHKGRAITLPAEPHNMPLDKAIEALQRRQKDLEQPYRLHEVFDAYPHDAAVAFSKALQNLYGFASYESEEFKMFGMVVGKEPPTMLSVRTGIGDQDFVLCPLGKLRVPGVSDPITTMFWTPGRGQPHVFLIHGDVKKRDRHILLELATETRRILKESSIYKGKPLRIAVDEEGNLNTSDPPTFMDVRDMTMNSILFDDETMEQIDTNLLVPIKNTERCRAANIPIGRKALFEGPFGTGKSLTARLVARICELNGWTFILLDRVQGLKTALEFARRYSPACVFAEDIDRIACERTDEMNDLINVIDGVISKGSEIMVILTTNYAEKLNPVILRPGRLDAVISIRAPGAKTVERLIRHYAGDMLHADVILTNSGKELKDNIPASIRECVERAKLGMIGRGDTQLEDRDIVIAAQTMKNHLALLNKDQHKPTNAEVLEGSLKSIIKGAANDFLEENETLGSILNHVS